MGARNVMTYRAAIERAGVAEDEYGPAGPSTWAAHIAALPCHFWQTAEREVVADKAAVVGDARMMVPRGTDITERDRINGIVDRRGQVVRAGVMTIDAVIPRRDHLELALTGVGA